MYLSKNLNQYYSGLLNCAETGAFPALWILNVTIAAEMKTTYGLSLFNELRPERRDGILSKYFQLCVSVPTDIVPANILKK